MKLYKPHTQKRASLYSLLTACVATIWLLAGTAGCHGQQEDEDPESVADSFADAYFNYDYVRAMRYSTPESSRWIQFAASNIYQADIDALRAMETGATAKTTDINDGDTDSTLVATVQVDGYLLRDTIGKAGRVVDGLEFKLPMVKRQGKWLVHLDRQIRGKEE